MPPELNSPRGVTVTTLYPASRSGLTPRVSADFAVEPQMPQVENGFERPALARPGMLMTVGASTPAAIPAAGKKLVLMSTPSNETTR